MPGACDRRATPRGGMLRRPIRERTYEMEYLAAHRGSSRPFPQFLRIEQASRLGLAITSACATDLPMLAL